MSNQPWQIWIDTGGTFTDCIAVDPEGQYRSCKVLSSGALRDRIDGIDSGGRVHLRGDSRLPDGFLTGFRCAVLGDGVEMEIVDHDHDTGGLQMASRDAVQLEEGTPVELRSGEEGVSLHVMTSAGGLTDVGSYRAMDSLLSGPAGGVVGAATAGCKAGTERVIAFDMGGTSTDVARFDSDFEYVFAHRVGPVELGSPALAIETVAAGGGSICRVDQGRLAVGPQSAGADPGPASYGAGGPLSLTDVNLLLGRLVPARLPIPITIDAARDQFVALRRALGDAETEDDEAILEGLLRIADERMAEAIRHISVRKGFDPVELRIPEGLLNPPYAADPRQCPAVVGGNVETSQRLVDTLVEALRLAGCSQGTMNNLSFGDDSFGYYETVAGGSGAGEGFDGTDGVHTHMTNTRITDPEVLEHRYPARLHRFAVRRGSGGGGRWRGGDGLVREIEFLAPLELSILSQHRVTAPFGMAGGSDGAVGRQVIVRPDGSRRELLGIDGCEVEPGDRLVLETPGSGGYGGAEI